MVTISFWVVLVLVIMTISGYAWAMLQACWYGRETKRLKEEIMATGEKAFQQGARWAWMLQALRFTSSTVSVGKEHVAFFEWLSARPVEPMEYHEEVANADFG